MAEEKSSSIIDQPVTLSRDDKLNEKDKFGISRYEKALTEFIRRADTPLTIALQGEWGSGKTSLMNLLKYHLCEADNAPYFSVWINTWQHSIMSDPEDAIIGILQSIIYQLGNAMGKTAEEKKKRISPIIEKSVKIAGIGAANIAGRLLLGVANAGSDMKAAIDSAREQRNVPETGESKIAELRNAIAELIDGILEEEKKKTNGCKGFLFFIDDLDRIDPPVAVQILELLKNIFDLKHCIYVLAIDYDVVVKGLKPKFGELTDKNAREFRSFFDKIIQLPFAMPVGSYQIDTFLIDVLNRIGYLTPEEQKNDALKQNLSDMAKFSVGTNPRSLKRLTNILSLIQLMTEGMKRDADSEPQSAEDALIDKQVNFGLVCLQITYPLVYNTLLEYPNFRHWGDDEKEEPGDGGKISLIKKLSLQELSEEQQHKLEKQGDLFDEPWEKALFRICLKDNYLAGRASDISRLLNKISEIIPKEPGEDKTAAEQNHDNAVAETIGQLIRFSAVTNVHVTEETVVAKKIEDFNPSWWLKQFREKFVHALNTRLGDLDTIQCISARVRTKLSFRFQKHTEAFARMCGDDAIITIGHDDTSYNVSWLSISKVFWGGFESVEDEEKLLGCTGLHDSVMKELEDHAAKYQKTISLVIDDTYPQAHGDSVGQKYASIIPHVMCRCGTLEEVITDEVVQQFAEFIAGLLRILFRLVPETHALCLGHDAKLREQLERMSLAPFTNRAQWYSQTYLQGCRLDGNTFGISLWLRSSGFQCIIWEGCQHDRAHNGQIVSDLMNAHPELRAVFPEHKEGDWAWGSPGIIPFDSVIDWLKELQKILISLQ